MDLAGRVAGDERWWTPAVTRGIPAVVCPNRPRAPPPPPPAHSCTLTCAHTNRPLLMALLMLPVHAHVHRPLSKATRGTRTCPLQCLAVYLPHTFTHPPPTPRMPCSSSCCCYCEGYLSATDPISSPVCVCVCVFVYVFGCGCVSGQLNKSTWLQPLLKQEPCHCLFAFGDGICFVRVCVRVFTHDQLGSCWLAPC